MWALWLQQQPPTEVDAWKSTFTLLLLLAVFGYLGWRRGLAREVAVLGAIFLAQLVRSSSLGPKVINYINNIYLMVSIAIRARFSLTRIMEIVSQENLTPLIPPERTEAALFILFFLILFLGYAVGRFLPVQPSPMAIVVGMLNGYLIGSTVLPLLPRTLPATLPGQQIPEPQREEAARVMSEGMRQLSDLLGIQPVHVLLLVVAVFLIWAVLELR